MPIRDPEGLTEYKPTEKERMIAERLRASVEEGLAYSVVKRSISISHTALSKFLRRMQHYGLIMTDDKGRYHLTIIGLRFLMSADPIHISEDELRARRKKDTAILWRQVHKLQEKVLRVAWLPYADEGSRLLFKASGGGPDLIYIGALRNAKGRQVLSLTTPDLPELKRLGYIHK
jgi:predicted transcriptional regulator